MDLFWALSLFSNAIGHLAGSWLGSIDNCGVVRARRNLWIDAFDLLAVSPVWQQKGIGSYMFLALDRYTNVRNMCDFGTFMHVCVLHLDWRNVDRDLSMDQSRPLGTR